MKDTGPSGPNTYTRVATHAIANCVPQGSITAASCYQVNVKLWDPNQPASSVKFYVSVNGGAKYGPGTVNGQGATATNFSVLNAPGFDPWKANSVALYGVDLQTGGQQNVGTVTLTSICDSLSCVGGGSSLPSDLVAGEKYPFQVWVHVNGPPGATTVPPGGKFTAINIDTLHTTSNATVTGNNLYSANLTYTPQTAGTYTLSWTFSGGESRPNPTTCTQNNVKVSYEPYFTVDGGDVSAGQGFGAACSDNPSADIEGTNLDTSGSYFGASSRQAAIATGQISQFATDVVNNIPGNLGGNSEGAASPFSPSRLALANKSPAGVTYPQGTTYGGNYMAGSSQPWCVPDYAAGVGAATGTVMPTSSSLSGLVASPNDYVFRVSSAGDKQLNGDINLQPGVHVVLLITGGSNLYLNGNVNYAGYSTLEDIPQLTVIVKGGNVYVDSGVQSLHGFYVAQPTSHSTGLLYTCASGPNTAAIDYGTCNQPLTFYGGVAAGQIIPGRTYGNIAKSSVPDNPGEQFVFTPELWLGATSGPVTSCSVDPTQAQCLYQSYTSLPPVL